MFVSKKHFKKSTKKSLFLPIEKRKRSCSSVVVHFFIIYCHTLLSIGNRGKEASLLTFLFIASYLRALEFLVSF